MHFTLQLLILGSNILRATYAEDNQSSQSIKCVDLNFQAAALQSDDSCALLNAVINGVDILAVDMIDIDATCGFHLEGVDHPMCVDEVVDVVAGLTGEECLVTGGASVADFISTVDVNKEGFSALTRLACRKIGECYADIQSAVNNCNENPSDEGCMDSATCDCVMDFLSVIEALPEDFVNLDGAIIDKVEIARTTCMCEDLNSRSLYLELGPSCALSTEILKARDILAGDDSTLADTCNANAVDDTTSCVDGIVEVAGGFIEYGCAVTYDNAEFIYTLHDSSEDFKAIIDFACNNDCYPEIKKCQNDTKCTESLSCECMSVFLSIVEGLSPDTKEDFLNIDDSTINDMQRAVEKCNCGELNADDALFQDECRCKDLNSRSLSLELGPSCALFTEILKAGDILAGDDSTLADTCNANAVDETASCVDGIVEVVGGFIEYGCAVTYDNAEFIYTLHDSSEDFKTITAFACNNDCYPAIKKCQNDTKCTESLSCECMSVFLSIVKGLSPDTKEDFLSIDDSTINDMQRAVVKCNCGELNADAALFQDEGYCALHNSIVKGRSIFAGDSSDIESTCAERHSCVGNVTDIVAQINDEGCEIKQDTDYGAKFISNVNSNPDWSEMTHFICNSHEDLLLEPDEGCYDEIKDVTESCMGDAADNCTESARSVCLDAFMDMVERLSDDSLLGIDSVVLTRMKSGKGIDYADAKNDVTALPTNETTSTANQTQPETAPQPSGAAFKGASTIVMLLALALNSLKY